MFKLDKSVSKANTADETEAEMKNYKNFSISERLLVGNYLNSIAFQFDIHHPPKMDKMVFEARAGK